MSKVYFNKKDFKEYYVNIAMGYGERGYAIFTRNTKGHDLGKVQISGGYATYEEACKALDKLALKDGMK